MKNAEQLSYRELNHAETSDAYGGWVDPFTFLIAVADTLIDMIEDPNCGCGGGTVYHP